MAVSGGPLSFIEAFVLLKPLYYCPSVLGLSIEHNMMAEPVHSQGHGIGCVCNMNNVM